MKKAVKTLITFSFLFLQKFYLTGLLTNILRALISMTLKINAKWKKKGAKLTLKKAKTLEICNYAPCRH